MFLEKENQGFFESAKNGLNETWRYIVGGILIFFGWQTVASAPLLALMGYIAFKGGKMSMNIAQAGMEVGVSKNVTLAIMISTFMLACGVLWLVVRFFHKKRFLSLITSRVRFSWKRALFGFGLWLTMSLLTLGYSYFTTPENFILTFNLETFLPLLLICLFLLPFQTSFEELLFRGYATQGVGLVTGSRFLALLLPSLAFGLLHSFNPEVFKYGFWLMMPFYIGMGLFLGIIALMDEGIEIPMGVHFANNLTAALFVNVESSALQTDAIFMVKNYNPIEEIPFSLAMMFIFLALSSWFFKWKDWGKLWRKI